jgi:hypothetical protein
MRQRGGGDSKASPISDQSQIEGMDLKEYQAMPSLRDVAHDGVLCTFSVIDQTQTGTSGVVHQGRRHGPSITNKITPCWLGHSPPASQPGGPPCWVSPLAFGLIDQSYLYVVVSE